MRENYGRQLASYSQEIMIIIDTYNTSAGIKKLVFEIDFQNDLDYGFSDRIRKLKHS